LPERWDAQAFLFILKLVLFVGFDLISDDFNVGHVSAIVLAKTKVLNSSETSWLIFETRYHYVFYILNGILAEEVLLENNISLVVFALCTADESLNKGAHLLCPLQGGGDTLMLHQVGNEISEHRLSVLGVAAELSDFTLVPHFIIINN
jgi:hypothetical protein